MKRFICSSAVVFLLTHLFTAAWAAEVVIPDAALKSVIWHTLGRPPPAGTLTEQDMLSLTTLNANSKGVKDLEGLGAAHNLTALLLAYNQLTNLALPTGLTRLINLELSFNQLTTLTLPDWLTNLTGLFLSDNQLTSLTLPDGLTSLTGLFLSDNQLTSLTLPAGLTNLTRACHELCWRKVCTR